MSSLWDNPMVTAAKNAMSEEELEKYRKIGESMFKDIDFTSSKVTSEEENSESFFSESVAYISESLKSGLHPSMLTDNEKLILQNFYGEEWYTKWNYVKEDLTEIKTLTKS
jgi:hypothetical protein